MAPTSSPYSDLYATAELDALLTPATAFILSTTHLVEYLHIVPFRRLFVLLGLQASVIKLTPHKCPTL
jgi:hypothetical protein